MAPESGHPSKRKKRPIQVPCFQRLNIVTTYMSFLVWRAIFLDLFVVVLRIVCCFSGWVAFPYGFCGCSFRILYSLFRSSWPPCYFLVFVAFNRISTLLNIMGGLPPPPPIPPLLFRCLPLIESSHFFDRHHFFKHHGGASAPPPPPKKMEKRGGLGGRGRSVGVIGSNVVIQRFNTLV